MKFRNPWIDPRVADLRPEVVQVYLAQHGWKEVGPAENPNLLRYETTDPEAPTLFLPRRTDNGAALQWMIELIGTLALWQGRYAAELLSDVLRCASVNGSNGPTSKASVPACSGGPG
jgi:hypothetical protein